jgi:fumarate reductase subunit D
MKRSHEPVFWALFGAGGMLSALIGPVLIFITGIALPIGWLLDSSVFSYANMLAFTQHPLGKIAVLAVISLFLFHGCHRMVHSLHDLGLHPGTGARAVSYGFAMLATIIAGYLLVQIGF